MIFMALCVNGILKVLIMMGYKNNALTFDDQIKNLNLLSC